MVHNPNSTKARKAYVCCAVSVREIAQKYFFLPLFFLFFAPDTQHTAAAVAAAASRKKAPRKERKIFKIDVV
jgi:hypothetical protein